MNAAILLFESASSTTALNENVFRLANERKPNGAMMIQLEFINTSIILSLTVDGAEKFHLWDSIHTFGI